MNLLLDTHTTLWLMFDPARLSLRARSLMADRANSLAVSIASLWEITIKMRTGKISLPFSNIDPIIASLDPFRIEILPLEPHHLRALETLPMIHRDPFDRILIAQSQAEGIPLITVDSDIRKYSGNFLW